LILVIVRGIRNIPAIFIYSMSIASRCYAIALFPVVFGAAAAPKTDEVIFNNGDHLTGEIKSLDHGKLRFKTNATDTIGIEWDDIAYLASNQNLQIEMENGDRFLGKLVRADEPRMLSVITTTESHMLNMEHVVYMTPIESMFVERIDGDLKLGFDFTKASEVTHFNVGLDVNYRTELRIVSIDLDSIITDGKDSDRSRRQSLDFRYTRLWPKRWVSGVIGALERNEELGTDLRSSIGAGGGRFLRKTNVNTILVVVGLQFSREEIDGDEPSENTLEGLTTVTADWFRYDTPELKISIKLEVYPVLSDLGRVRGDADIRFNWEIIEDFFWELRFYDSFDNEPPSDEASENDYGITTSLGWDF